MYDNPPQPLGRRVITWCRQLPITTALLCVMLGLFGAVQAYRLAYPDDAHNVYWRLGTPSVLEISYPSELEMDSPHGFFDLWRGEVWRVVVSAFHHGNLLHLLMNGASLALLGYLLEPRMGRIRFLAFTLVTASVSLLPEFLNGSQAVGISGALCAMLGMLMVMRRHDDEVAMYLTDTVVMISLTLLIGCAIATYAGVLHIANLAHFSGLGYGLLAGEIFYGRWSGRVWRWTFYAAHLCFIPAVYFLIHPTWDGNYHWYQAIRADDPAQRRKHYETAVQLDPGLTEPWHAMASHQIEDGNPHEAWRTILRGLSFNRSDKRGALISRRIWNGFRTAEGRQRALQSLEEVFGDEAEAWKERLRLVSPPLAFGGLPPWPKERDLERFRLDQSIELPTTIDGSDASGDRDLNAPSVNPDDPQSAAVGTAT